MPRVLMVASEAAPFAKTGGLADVVGSLPRALASLGHDTAVLLPRYRSVPLKDLKRVYDHLPIWMNGHSFTTVLYRSAQESPAFYFLDCPALYDREDLYGTGDKDFPDNHFRFAALCRAALEIVRRIFRAQIIHCHDWQSGLVPAYLHGQFAYDPTFFGIKTLFTIHNLAYQGRYSPKILADVGLDPEQFSINGVEFKGDVSFLKAGLYYSDALSTVSEGYAREICTPEFGEGMQGLLYSRRDVLRGILNGVDYGIWNPETDPYVAANYSACDLSGKTICKRALLEELSLPADDLTRPVIGVVSRLTAQKGSDLIAAIAGDLVAMDAFVVVLGAGERKYEEMFRTLAAAHPDHIAVRIARDERLAHMIEAGADIFLMPSRYEPCGLNQFYSLRYGTIPVVRATGGLDDTIEESTGFKFRDYSAAALLESVRAALDAFADKAEWTARMRRAMGKDFSWTVSAAKYSRLYQRLAGGVVNPGESLEHLSSRSEGLGDGHGQ